MAEAAGLIEVRELSKKYGDKIAVNGLSFTVEPGHVTGFLGPNGAGKSTTMRLIVGLDRPSSGSATIDGLTYAQLRRPLHGRRRAAGGRARCTPAAAPATTCCTWPRHRASPPGGVDEVLEMVGLTAVARKRAGGFSLGMTQRLGIAAAMLGDPRVLMLDEPVNGLDPEGIRWVRNFMQPPGQRGPHGPGLQPPDERDGADR